MSNSVQQIHVFPDSNSSVKWKQPDVDSSKTQRSSKPRRLRGLRVMVNTTEASCVASKIKHVEKVEEQLGLQPKPPGNITATHNPEYSQNEHRNANRSRARCRKTWEVSPFLSIDTVPSVEVTVDEVKHISTTGPKLKKSTRTFHKERKCSARYQQRSQTPRAPSRCSSRGTPFDFYSFYTHRNPSFITGPPNLWSMGNKFWPNVNMSYEKRRNVVPSAMAIESSSLQPNQQVAQPFKQADNSEFISGRTMAPDLDLKLQTAKAIHAVSKSLANGKDSPPTRKSGRLLKARLKPLHAFTPVGPTVDRCAGVQPEKKPQSPSQLRLLLRKEQLLNMLPPDIFEERPATRESVHRTSIASNLSEDREQDFDGLALQSEASQIWSRIDKIPPNSMSSFGDELLGNPMLLGQVEYPSDTQLEEQIMQYMSVQSPNKALSRLGLGDPTGDSVGSFSDVLIDGAAGMIDSALTKGRHRRKPVEDKLNFSKKSILKTSKTSGENIFSGLIWNGNSLERVQTAPEPVVQNMFGDESFDVDGDRPQTAPEQSNILEAVARQQLEKIQKEENTEAMEQVQDYLLESKPDHQLMEEKHVCELNNTVMKCNIPDGATDNLEYLIQGLQIEGAVCNTNNVSCTGNDLTERETDQIEERQVTIVKESEYKNMLDDQRNIINHCTDCNKENKKIEFDGVMPTEEHHTTDIITEEHHTTDIITEEHHTTDIITEEHHTTDIITEEHHTTDIITEEQELLLPNSRTNDEQHEAIIQRDSNGAKDRLLLSIDIISKPNRTSTVDIEMTMQKELSEACLQHQKVYAPSFNDVSQIAVLNTEEPKNLSENKNKISCVDLTEMQVMTGIDVSGNSEAAASMSAEVIKEKDAVYYHLERLKSSNELDSPSFEDVISETDRQTKDYGDDATEDKIMSVKENPLLDLLESADRGIDSISDKLHLTETGVSINSMNQASYHLGMKVNGNDVISNTLPEWNSLETADNKARDVDCIEVDAMLISPDHFSDTATDLSEARGNINHIPNNVTIVEFGSSASLSNHLNIEHANVEETVPCTSKDATLIKEENEETPSVIGDVVNATEENMEDEEENIELIADDNDFKNDDKNDSDGSGSSGGSQGRSQGGNPDRGPDPDHPDDDDNNRVNESNFKSSTDGNNSSTGETKHQVIEMLCQTNDCLGCTSSSLTDYNDIPEVLESVLFCGVCDLDEDDCTCLHSKVGSIGQMLSADDNSNMDISDKRVDGRDSSSKEGWSSREDLLLTDQANDLIIMYRTMYDKGAGEDSSSSACFSDNIFSPRLNPAAAALMVKGQPVGQTNHADHFESIAAGMDRKDSELDVGRQWSKDGEVTTVNPSVQMLDNPDCLTVVAESKEISKAKVNVDTRPIAPFPPICFRINARPPPGHVYYFAYGENMNPNRLSLYVGRQEVQRLWGILFGFQIKFNKKGSDKAAGVFANIEFNPESSVEGCVYLITKEELKNLEKFMGCPQFFTHVMFPVWMINSLDPDALGIAQYCIPAVTYIAQDKWTTADDTLMSDYSVQQCLRGSELLSPRYVEHIAGCAIGS